MSFRKLLPLGVLVVISFTLMTYQAHRGVLSPLRFIESPFHRVSGFISSIAASLTAPFHRLTLREEENRRLRDETNRLMAEQQRALEIYHENRRLRELLSLKERERRYVATARIISRGPDRWRSTLMIDKGRNQGVQKDMAVVTPAGLIGKVIAASDDHAQILLVTDTSFSAAVKVQETRYETILSGDGSSGCILKYVPQEVEIKEGSLIVTSGFDDLFPKELPVGVVAGVSRKGSSVFQQILVRPHQDLRVLDEVVLLRR
jgi:rod shape-determining protein MreC